MDQSSCNLTKNSLGQSSRSILERRNSAQSQSLPAQAPAATVLNKKGNKSKQENRSKKKVESAKQAKVEITRKQQQDTTGTKLQEITL